MVRAKKHPARILSQTEIEGLREEQRELQEQLDTSYGVGTAASQIDKGRLKARIAEIDHIIGELSAPSVRGASKDRLVKEAEELEEQLAVGMPTRWEMDHPAKCPGAVRKHINWESRNRARIERYRYIQQVINPDAPRSVESLRKDK
jgi:hypothetical protein